jgi:HEAT repeat protein
MRILFSLAASIFLSSHANRHLGELQNKLRLQRVESLAQMAEMGPVGKAAIVPLTELLSTPDAEVQLLATLALGKLGAEAVPALRKKLTHDDEMVRCHAVWALALMGPGAKSALAALIKALKDPEPEVRSKAAYALGRVDTESAAALSALITTFADPDNDVRSLAMESVGQFSDKGIEPLHRLIKSGKPPVEALWALDKIAEAKEDEPLGDALYRTIPDLCRLYGFALDKFEHEWSYPLGNLLPRFGSRSVGELLPLLSEKDNNQRYNICDVLAEIARQLQRQRKEPRTVQKIARKLRDLLGDDDSLVRQHSLWGLMSLDADTARFALPALHELLHKLERHWECSRTRGAITRLEGDPVPQMKKKLKATRGAEQLKLAVGLMRLENDEDAIAILKAHLAHPDQDLRHQAAYALATWRCWDQHKDLGPALIPIFRDGLGNAHTLRRREAARGLASVPEHSRSAFRELLQALSDKDFRTRSYALHALTGVVKAEPEKCLPLVLARLGKERNALFGYNYVDFLEQIGKSGVPELIALLRDKTLASQACWALSRMGRDGASAAPHLFTLIKKTEVKAWDQEITADALRALQILAGEKYFAPLLQCLIEHDTVVARTLKGKSAHEPTKLVRTLLVDIKSKDAEKSFPAANCLLRILPLLPKSAQESLAKEWMDPWRIGLPHFRHHLKTGNRELRRETVSLLIRLRHFGYEVYTLTEPCLEMCQGINLALARMRGDSDLLVRRQVRRALLIDLDHGMPLP